MIVYNKDDKSLEIPNGIGNLNLTINSGGGGDTPDLSNYATTQYVDEEILKVNNEIGTINEDIDVLEGRVIDLENNGGGSSGENGLVVSTFDYTNLNNAVTVFKKGGNVIFKNIDTNYPDIYVQMSGVTLNFSTMMYTIYAFSFENVYYFEIPVSSSTNNLYFVMRKTLKYE